MTTLEYSSTTSYPPRSVLIIGAGELGTALLTALAEHPALKDTALTVLLRPTTLSSKPEQLAALRGALPPSRATSSLSFVGADPSSPRAADDLARLLMEGGYDAVVSATGFAGGPGTQRAIADAVLRSGGPVRTYIPWQFGVDYDVIGPRAADGLFAEQCEVRDVLRAQRGVEWVVVSTGMFMSFVFEDFFGVVEGLAGELKGGGKEEGEVLVRGLGGWQNGVTLTAVEDIGKVVADIFARPVERNDRGGSVVYAAGQTITYSELADVIEKVVGGRRTVKREVWTPEYLAEELKKDSENQLKKYRVLFGEGKGVKWNMEKTINALRGIKTIGVEEWLRERLGA